VVFWHEKTQIEWYFGTLVLNSGILALSVLTSGILAILSIFLLLFCIVIFMSIHSARKKEQLDEMMNHELHTSYHAQTD
jgi:hypothetical protein